MSVFKHNIFLQVLLSASNLNGVAAMFLSYSLGSILGTVIFAFAAFTGCINKYKSLKGRNNTQNFILQRLTDPSVTAQILMIAAGINAVTAGYNIFNDSDHMAHHIYLMLAWTFGVLGDDALRRNDKTNFADDFIQKNRALWLRTFLYTTRNPVFYYILVNIFFSSSILASAESHSSILILTIANLIIGLCGVFYSTRQVSRMLKGNISERQMNDGVINIFIVLTNMVLALISIIHGMPFLIISYLLFSVANITTFFETRNALEKENI